MFDEQKKESKVTQNKGKRRDRRKKRDERKGKILYVVE
jgi:hypothetical protein